MHCLELNSTNLILAFTHPLSVVEISSDLVVLSLGETNDDGKFAR